MKVNLINVHQLIILTLVINTLSGCYNKKEFKRVIQDGFDSARKKANVKGDFCFYLGSVKFPYTDIPSSKEDTKWMGWNKEDLANTLPLFAEIGLLTRQPVKTKQSLFHYDLTELGQKYLYSFFNKTLNGDTIYNNAFCYGPIKVIEVTDVNEKMNKLGKNSNNETQFEVTINYQVINTPEWVINNQDKLKALYGSTSVRLPDIIYTQTLPYMKGKNGDIYQESSSYRVLQPSGKYLTDKQ